VAATISRVLSKETITSQKYMLRDAGAAIPKLCRVEDLGDGEYD
jgi:hypothetical protein